MNDYDSFISMVETLRKMGATRVKAGELEVEFPGPVILAETLPPEEDDFEAQSKAVREAWELDNYGSSG